MRLGLVLGRFQIFHKGHELIIDTALENCDKVLIFIGSSDKKDTFDNPFDYEFRKEIIETIYDSDKIVIAPLPDLGVGNVPLWGDYVINSAKNIIGMPDVIIYGKEDKCESWYKNYNNLEFIRVDRKGIDISSTKLKQIILDNDYDNYLKYVNEKISKYYDVIRKKLEQLR